MESKEDATHRMARGEDDCLVASLLLLVPPLKPILTFRLARFDSLVGRLGLLASLPLQSIPLLSNTSTSSVAFTALTEWSVSQEDVLRSSQEAQQASSTWPPTACLPHQSSSRGAMATSAGPAALRSTITSPSSLPSTDRSSRPDSLPSAPHPDLYIPPLALVAALPNRRQEVTTDGSSSPASVPPSSALDGPAVIAATRPDGSQPQSSGLTAPDTTVNRRREAAIQVASLHRASEVARYQWASHRGINLHNRRRCTPRRRSTPLASGRSDNAPSGTDHLRRIMGYTIIPSTAQQPSATTREVVNGAAETSRATIRPPWRMPLNLQSTVSPTTTNVQAPADPGEARFAEDAPNRSTGAGMMDISDSTSSEDDDAFVSDSENRTAYREIRNAWNSSLVGSRPAGRSWEPLSNEEALVVWDKLCLDLAAAAGVAGDDSDEEEDESTASRSNQPSSHVNTTLSFGSIANSRGGIGIMPHPIWAQRYQGPAGEWFREELTRRYQPSANSASSTTGNRPAPATSSNGNRTGATPAAEVANAWRRTQPRALPRPPSWYRADEPTGRNPIPTGSSTLFFPSIDPNDRLGWPSMTQDQEASTSTRPPEPPAATVAADQTTTVRLPARAIASEVAQAGTTISSHSPISRAMPSRPMTDRHRVLIPSSPLADPRPPGTGSHNTASITSRLREFREMVTAGVQSPMLDDRRQSQHPSQTSAMRTDEEALPDSAFEIPVVGDQHRSAAADEVSRLAAIARRARATRMQSAGDQGRARAEAEAAPSENAARTAGSPSSSSATSHRIAGGRGMRHLRHLRELDGLQDQAATPVYNAPEDHQAQRIEAHTFFPWYSPSDPEQPPSPQDGSHHVSGSDGSRDPNGDATGIDWYRGVRARMDQTRADEEAQRGLQDPDGEQIESSNVAASSQTRPHDTSTDQASVARRQRNRAALVVAEMETPTSPHGREIQSSPTSAMRGWTLIRPLPSVAPEIVAEPSSISSSFRQIREGESATIWLEQPARETLSTSPGSLLGVLPPGPSVDSPTPARPTTDVRALRRPQRLRSLVDEDLAATRASLARTASGDEGQPSISRSTRASSIPVSLPSRRSEITGPSTSQNQSLQAVQPSSGQIFENWAGSAAERDFQQAVATELDESGSSPVMRDNDQSRDEGSHTVEGSNSNEGLVPSSRRPWPPTEASRNVSRHLSSELQNRATELAATRNRLSADLARRRQIIDDLRQREGRIGRVLDTVERSLNDPPVDGGQGQPPPSSTEQRTTADYQREAMRRLRERQGNIERALNRAEARHAEALRTADQILASPSTSSGDLDGRRLFGEEEMLDRAQEDALTLETAAPLALSATIAARRAQTLAAWAANPAMIIGEAPLPPSSLVAEVVESTDPSASLAAAPVGHAATVAGAFDSLTSVRPTSVRRTSSFSALEDARTRRPAAPRANTMETDDDDDPIIFAADLPTRSQDDLDRPEKISFLDIDSGPESLVSTSDQESLDAEELRLLELLDQYHRDQYQAAVQQAEGGRIALKVPRSSVPPAETTSLSGMANFLAFDVISHTHSTDATSATTTTHRPNILPSAQSLQTAMRFPCDSRSTSFVLRHLCAIPYTATPLPPNINRYPLGVPPIISNDGSAILNAADGENDLWSQARSRVIQRGTNSNENPTPLERAERLNEQRRLLGMPPRPVNGVAPSSPLAPTWTILEDAWRQLCIETPRSQPVSWSARERTRRFFARPEMGDLARTRLERMFTVLDGADPWHRQVFIRLLRNTMASTPQETQDPQWRSMYALVRCWERPILPEGSPRSLPLDVALTIPQAEPEVPIPVTPTHLKRVTMSLWPTTPVCLTAEQRRLLSQMKEQLKAHQADPQPTTTLLSSILAGHTLHRFIASRAHTLAKVVMKEREEPGQDPLGPSFTLGSLFFQARLARRNHQPAQGVTSQASVRKEMLCLVFCTDAPIEKAQLAGWSLESSDVMKRTFLKGAIAMFTNGKAEALRYVYLKAATPDDPRATEASRRVQDEEAADEGDPDAVARRGRRRYERFRAAINESMGVVQSPTTATPLQPASSSSASVDNSSSACTGHDEPPLPLWAAWLTLTPTSMSQTHVAWEEEFEGETDRIWPGGGRQLPPCALQVIGRALRRRGLLGQSNEVDAPEQHEQSKGKAKEEETPKTTQEDAPSPAIAIDSKDKDPVRDPRPFAARHRHTNNRGRGPTGRYIQLVFVPIPESCGLSTGMSLSTAADKKCGKQRQQQEDEWDVELLHVGARGFPAEGRGSEQGKFNV